LSLSKKAAGEILGSISAHACVRIVAPMSFKAHKLSINLKSDNGGSLQMCMIRKKMLSSMDIPLQYALLEYLS
jgi:hypothetical protein